MRDNVIKRDKWEFDSEVANCFDDMLERSIPDYNEMRDLCFRVGRHFVKDELDIIDVGCSNGAAALPFVKTYNNHFILCDISESMLDLTRRGFSKHNNVDVLKHDITEGLPECNACLILSILTVQFTPIEYRQKIIKDIYNKLEKGGALIYVEKLLGLDAEMDNIFVDEYYKIKKENEYTQEQIQAKRKSLEGVLVPVTEKWNMDLLKGAGFSKVECFWRYLNFAGFLAVK